MSRLFAVCVLAVVAVALVACANPQSLLPAPLPVDTSDLAAGRFRADLNGVIVESLTGAAVSIRDPDIGIALYLEGERYAVNFVLPHDILVGTHYITSLLSAYDPQQRVRFVGASVTDDVPSPDTILPLTLYANVLQGRLTLTSVEPLTGAFEVTASDDSGATVTATGAFLGIVPVLEP